MTPGRWTIFTPTLPGTRLALSGDIAHAPEMRNWDIFRGEKSAHRADWQVRLQKFSDLLDRVHFTGRHI